MPQALFFPEIYMPSSVVRFMDYYAEKQILRIGYVSGKVYDYLCVPRSAYRRMKAAMSKGSFLNHHIKGRYAFREVEEG